MMEDDEEKSLTASGRLVSIDVDWSTVFSGRSRKLPLRSVSFRRPRYYSAILSTTNRLTVSSQYLSLPVIV